jgi:hypothetical protein
MKNILIILTLFSLLSFLTGCDDQGTKYRKKNS